VINQYLCKLVFIYGVINDASTLKMCLIETDFDFNKYIYSCILWHQSPILILFVSKVAIVHTINVILTMNVNFYRTAQTFYVSKSFFEYESMSIEYEKKIFQKS
jgi:hypothetical protein